MQANTYVNSVRCTRTAVAHRSEQTETMHSISAVWKNFHYSLGSYSSALFSLSLSLYIRCFSYSDTLHLRCTFEDPPPEDRYVKKKVRILFPEMLLFRAFSSRFHAP